jgi:WD40 repeat protein
LAEKARILKFNDLKSLIGSCLSSYPDNCKNYESPLQVILKKLSLSTRNQVNSYYLLQSNQLSSINADLRRFVHVYHWDNFNLLHAILGHLAPIYCLSYDLTGQYIITGADDHLVKIWSQVDGRLLATLRGHSAEVSDIALSLDNSLIASASNDKTIRIWDSHTSVPVTTLVGHSGIVTSIQVILCPYHLQLLSN